MKIHQIDHTQLVLSDLARDEIETSLEHPSLYLGAISLFVASLGRCTFAVLREYAMRLQVPVKPIQLDMYWTLSNEAPTKISTISVTVYWPELPENRVKAVERASKKCTVHHTIHECVEIDLRVLSREYVDSE